MPKKILIIDDMADFRQLARALLESELADIEIDELEGARDASQIQEIIQKKYDLILLDYQLQGHDGLSVQRDLRRAGCITPVILLTAYGNEKLAVQAIKEGAFDYISKAELDVKSLTNSVQDALRSKIERHEGDALFGDNIQISGYRPVKLLGRGTYSMVYLAENELTGRQVVLKLLIVSHVGSNDITRFMREYEIMGNLSHNNIGLIYEQSITEDIVFMLMEHLDGGSLKQRLETRKRYPEGEAIELMIQLFDALHYMHQHDVLHRDIKPANIVFRSSGTPVIVDFGIAAKIDVNETLTDSGSVVGTPAYMSPEQALGKTITSLSDIYSMGVVFYEMLTGLKPINGDTPHQTMYRIVHNKPDRLPLEFMHLQDIFDLLLAKDPDERFRSGGEIADILRHAQQSR